MIDGRQHAQIVSATCECQAGKYNAECLERETENGEGRTVRHRFTINQARYRGLVPPHPTSHTVYWLHAKLAEARHDMVRLGDEDDSRIRYLERAAAEHNIPLDVETPLAF